VFTGYDLSVLIRLEITKIFAVVYKFIHMKEFKGILFAEVDNRYAALHE